MNIDARLFTVIPAHPGYFLLCYIPPDSTGPELVYRTPVLAWQIRPADAEEFADGAAYAAAYPVTHEFDSLHADVAVLGPDGRVREPKGGDTTYDEWLDSERRKHEEQALVKKIERTR